MITVKILSRAENEVDNEIDFTLSRLRDTKRLSQPTLLSAVEAGENSCKSFLKRYNELLECKFAIRNAKGSFNELYKINSKTAEIALLERMIQAHESVTGYGQAASEMDYRTTSIVYRQGVSDDMVDEHRSDIRGLTRKVQMLKDSCNGINSSKDASSLIDKEVLEFLKDNNFIE